MLDKRAIEPVTSFHPKSGYHCRLFLVRKKSRGWRPGIDLSRLNRHIITPHFRMETLDSVRLALRKNDWAISLDLKDAYFYIPIHRKSKRYLWFHFMGKKYQFRALPFGLSPSPYAFSRIVKVVTKHCRRMGMRLHVYLDDWLQPSRSQVISLYHREQLLRTVLTLGFVPNWDKSELVPSQMFSFLGVRFDSVTGLISPSLDRQRPLVSGRPVMGLSHFPGSLVQSGCLPMAEEEFPVCNGATVSSSTRLFSVHGCKSGGWGAHMDNLSASGLWSAHWKGHHINILELRAVWLALKSFHQAISDSHVLLSTDNTTMAAYPEQRRWGRSRTLSFMATNLLDWCTKRHVSLTAKFVPEKLNVLADSLSRKGQIIDTEWTFQKALCPRYFFSWKSLT